MNVINTFFITEVRFIFELLTNKPSGYNAALVVCVCV
jgi:hypothetical protein